jgi:hypothetical protein
MTNGHPPSRSGSAGSSALRHGAHVNALVLSPREPEHALSSAFHVLQALAARFRRAFPMAESLMTLQALYVAGALSPWRLIELTRTPVGKEKRMLCFETLESLSAAIYERLAWQRADEEFVARNLSTPGGFPGVTVDWVHSKDFDLLFGSMREQLRTSNCPTIPTRTVSFR